MSIIIPSRFVYEPGLDSSRVARAQPISTIEVTDLVEAPHWIYAAHNRAQYSYSAAGQVQTTSSSHVPLPFNGAYHRIHENRSGLLCEVWAGNAEVIITIRNATNTTTLATATLNAAASPAILAVSTITGLTAQEVVILGTYKAAAAGAAVFKSVRLLEAQGLSASLP